MKTNPDNYKWGLYFNRSDSRVIVPKQKHRMRWGLTFNFARPESYLIIAVFIVIILIIAGKLS